MYSGRKQSDTYNNYLFHLRPLLIAALQYATITDSEDATATPTDG